MFSAESRDSRRCSVTCEIQVNPSIYTSARQACEIQEKLQHNIGFIPNSELEMMHAT